MKFIKDFWDRWNTLINNLMEREQYSTVAVFIMIPVLALVFAFLSFLWFLLDTLGLVAYLSLCVLALFLYIRNFVKGVAEEDNDDDDDDETETGVS